MKPVDFLFQVWNHVCEQGDYVFLSTRGENKKGWNDYHFKFDSSIKGRVRDWLRQQNPAARDVYFCPLPFKAPERLAKNVKPVNLLWSDVDDGDPYLLRPTVLWESSPTRHHALWFLKERMHADDAAQLNKSVTYHLGADKGGWDLSQVLRIPGTFNHKYESKPEVKLVHWDRNLLSPDIIAKKVKHSIVKFEAPESMNADAAEILKNYRLSARVSALLHGEAEVGRRSEVLWYLENKLSEAGMSPEEIICVIKESDWNKFKGRHDEDDRLRTELTKVIEKQIDATPKKTGIAKQVQRDGFQVQTFGEVMSSLQTTPGWLIPGFWMKQSHGIVAGEPKSMKTTLFMDAMISIATGAPFLGKYPVEETGPVLYIQNENAEWIMRDRFEKMLKSKGLVGKASFQEGNPKLKIRFSPEVPMNMVNQQGFTLTDEDHQAWLEETIAEMRPAVVVLDPLYLMFDGDIASAQELFPILQYLLYLKNEYRCGIVLIHHWNKGGESKRGGQRMLGSTTLHGWIESAWYLKSNPTDGDEAEIVMEREFRGAGLHGRLDIRVTMGDMGDPTYNVTVDDWHEPEEQQGQRRGQAKPETMSADIVAMLASKKGISESYIASHTGYNAKQIREVTDSLITAGTAYRQAGKLYLKESA
jgi:hypothetical protein